MGIKHCGKSTQGRLLAKHFACPFFDTDDLIEERSGMSPREIYSTYGKERFLQEEAEACRFLSETKQEFCVIATGGGICNNPVALEHLKKIGTFIFLNSDESIACGRIIREIHILENGTLENLPAYIAKENPSSIDDVRKSFHNFYAERQKIYEQIADVKVDMKAASRSENMNEILKAL